MIGGIVGGSKWEVLWVQTLYSSLSYNDWQLSECDEVTVPHQKHVLCLWEYVQIVRPESQGSVSKGSDPLERVRVRVGTGTEPWQ